MRKYLFFIAVLFCFNICRSQSVYSSLKGEVTFYSYAPLEDIKAKSTQVNSFFNISTGQIAFIIPIRSFHFEKALMEEHFNEKYMESEKFPQATFQGSINEKIDISVQGKTKITAKGKLTIHGIEKEINETGELEINNDTLSLTTHFYTAIDNYGIKKPELLFQNIADTIEVKMNAIYLPYKKK